MCESSFFKYLLSFQLPSISHLAYTAKRVTSALVTSETYRSSIIFFPLPPYSYHTVGWKSPSLYTQTSFTSRSCSLYRLLHGLVLYAIWLSSREASRIYLDFFALARVFIHSIAFIQGGFTSSPSCMQSFKEVLLALLLACVIHGGFTSSPIWH